ncbi:MAG: SRPBCC family protein [Anaerolineae bacterium]
MPRLVEQIEVARRPIDLFRLCHDVDRRAEWDERVTRVQVLTRRPVRSGSVVRVDTRPPAGSVFSWEGEVVDYSFPGSSRVEVIDAAPSSYFVTGSEEWRFETSNTGTLFTLTWDYQPGGLIGRVADVLIRRGNIRRAIKQSLENLKALAEAET